VPSNWHDKFHASRNAESLGNPQLSQPSSPKLYPHDFTKTQKKIDSRATPQPE
jgi:hypothetical protein